MTPYTDHMFFDARMALAQAHDVDLYACARDTIRLCAQRGALRGMPASLVRLLHADIVEARLIGAAQADFVHRPGIADEPDLFVRAARVNRAMEDWLAQFLESRGDLEAAVLIGRTWHGRAARTDLGPGV